MNEKNKKIIKIIIIGLVLVLFFHWVFKFLGKKSAQEEVSPPVIVQQPVSKMITDYVTQTGTVVAYNAVDLVARIEGYLEANNFTDGTFIQKGKELFIIEPQPYLEKLKEAEASVVAQKASYAYAEAEYERQKRMYQQNATSLNNVEKWEAQTLERKAEIEKAVANAAVAAINYSYTHVLAPFDGRIGRHLVDPGNLVGNGKATDLATIEQIDPIYVYFNLNELDVLKIRASIRANDFDPVKLREMVVGIKMQNETDYRHQGHLDYVNTGLNASTGTLECRALLDNKDYALLPGFFVQVRIPVSTPKSQLTIPDEALLYDQIGTYVLIANEKNRVEVRRVTIGALDKGRRAILKGLNPKDRVIVKGLQNATPGNPVRIVSENHAK